MSKTSINQSTGKQSQPVLHLQGGGVVFIGEKVLVRKSKIGVWIFPKGHVEPGEELFETAQREIREETGIIARAVASLGKINYVFKDEPYEVHFFLMEFRRRTDAWTKHLGVDAFLFEPEEAMGMLEYESYREFLQLALKERGKGGSQIEVER